MSAEDLEHRAERCRDAAKKAFAAGDYKHMRELEREAESLTRQAREVRSGLDPARHWK